MQDTGMHNPDNASAAFGLSGTGKVFWNLSEPALCERAIARGEARLSAHGALTAETGAHTARSPQDRYFVREPETEDTVWWDHAQALTREQFDALKDDMLAHAAAKTLFAQDLEAGADPAHRVRVRVYAEHAWHSLFIRTLLRRPCHDDLPGFVPQLTVLCAPGFRAEPARHGVHSPSVIACDLARGVVLIGGTLHAGEIRSAVLSHLNYLLPAANVLPLHGAATVGEAGDVALLLGLSGTGKTALSADPARALVGSGAFGWNADGVFNVEAGCYVRTPGLSREGEPAILPAILAATERFGAVLENVVLNADTREPAFDDVSLSENARAAYPIEAVANAVAGGRANAPKTLVMLTCDTLGVMPPLAKLTPAQAMYHFLSGYTARVAGAEKGVSEPEPVFSAGFGAPLLPRHPSVYGNLLRDLIAENGVECWLLNTGWSGGKAGDATSNRLPLAVTKRLLDAVLRGELETAEFRTDPHFGFAVPTAVEGVEPRLLDPSRAWVSRMDYAKTARRLVAMFTENFARVEAGVDEAVRHAQPGMAIAAE